MYGRRRLTRLEAGIYAAVCATLMAVFLDKALDYMAFAEKATMLATLNLAASAINTRTATDMLQHTLASPMQWAGRNPFEIAGKAPSSFVGDLGKRELSSLERPCWTFDSQSGDLIYLPQWRRGLRAGPDEALHFRLITEPRGYGYKLVSTSPYEWRPLE